MKPKYSEKDLAAIVVSDLTEQGWEIYQEVETGWGRADIVAKNGNILWVIECKMSFSLAVIEQAWNHIRSHKSHFVSVAVQVSKHVGKFAEEICKRFGIGILSVNLNRESMTEKARPNFYRKANGLELHEEQKTWCLAGSQSGGGHYTPFKATVRDLVDLVRKHPEGLLFADAVKSIDHHYSSLATAKACLSKFIGVVIPNLRLETIDKKIYVFLNE